MPNMDWAALSQKSKQKFGAYGEYYAKMEFTSYGLDVFTSEVDDHGIDFVVHGPQGFHQIQVKSIQAKTEYVCLEKAHFDNTDPHLWLCLLQFEQGCLPLLYLIPATSWQQTTTLFRDYSYGKPGQTSKPEYGLNLSHKNLPLLEPFSFDKMIKDF